MGNDKVDILERGISRKLKKEENDSYRAVVLIPSCTFTIIWRAFKNLDFQGKAHSRG